MLGSHPVRWMIALLCSSLAAFGCTGTDTQQGASGPVSLNLVLAGGVEIDVVDWEITGNGMDMGGSVDVSASGSTASIEVFGLPVGEEPYLVELSAVSVDQEVTCTGSAEFEIEVGVSTQVMVMVNCKRQEQLGAVRANGKFNFCSELTKVVVSPLQTSVGNDISLFSTAEDQEGDAIAYMWSSDSGSIADPMAAATTYTCTEMGDDDITILVSDDDGDYCMSMWTVRVTCVAGGANLCDDVTCEDDGNECTDAACNPANGLCETSNNSNPCDGGAGTCNAGVCEPNPECSVDADCPDTGNECIDPVCNAGTCGTSNNSNPCDGGAGTCDAGVCEPNPECSVDADCPGTGNECIDPVCNAGTCGTSNNSNPCDGGAGTCDAGVCEPNPECAVDGDCPDTGNECIDPVCDAGTCGTSNNSNPCDGGAGTCDAGVCEPNPECVVDADCPDTGNECIDAVCDAGTCGTSNNTNVCDGGAGTCDGAGVCVPDAECVVAGDCTDDGNECTDPVCNAGVCETSNNANACDGGAGTCDGAGVCVPNAEVFYFQDFNQLDIEGGVIGDGWAYFVNVFATPFYNYGGPAPNGPQISALVAGQGGPEQEPQQLSVYSDYNNADHGNGILIETNVFQEPFGFNNRIPQSEVGKTYTFSFQAKQGNINDPADVNCAAPNVCDVTANAFIKTLDPDAGFQTSDSDVVDTTAVGSTWTGYTLTLDITQDRVGDLLQFGFQTNATNFEPSGNFYDNVLVTVE